MRLEDQVRVNHMVEAAGDAAQFIVGRTRADLDTDRMLLFALIRCVEIIGEAARQVTDETRTLCEDIPWNAIAGMRNRLIHAYFDVDAELVWKTVTVELPVLTARLRKLQAA
jgi:uncharacterized protein with HEPN domain